MGPSRRRRDRSPPLKLRKPWARRAGAVMIWSWRITVSFSDAAAAIPNKRPPLIQKFPEIGPHLSTAPVNSGVPTRDPPMIVVIPQLIGAVAGSPWRGGVVRGWFG